MSMSNDPLATNRSTRKETNPPPVIIIGAGPAGLAVGACLQQAGPSCLILEQSDNVGASLRHHYDRLHLHTASAYSGLPFFPLPKDYPRYPSRLQVIEYLETYARQFQLPIHFGRQVTAARLVDGYWKVHTPDALYQSRNLVVATGNAREPHLPVWPGQASFQGTILHSSQYKNGEPFKNQNVLVVGFGNSGGEIAIDLWEHGAGANLAVRGPVNVIPRELLGMPILAIGIAQRRLPARWADGLNSLILHIAIGDLTRYGLRRLPYGPVTQIREAGRIPLIDVGTIKLIKAGQVAVFPGIESFTRDGVIFTDGRHLKVDAVILATGYQPRVNTFLEVAAGLLDENGKPARSGYETSMPGLYFCGYYVSPTGMLREIALEARRISAAIVQSPTPPVDGSRA